MCLKLYSKLYSNIIPDTKLIWLTFFIIYDILQHIIKYSSIWIIYNLKEKGINIIEE